MKTETSDERRARHITIVKRIIIGVLTAAFIIGGLIPMSVVAFLMHKNFGRCEYVDDRFTCDYRYEHYAAEYPRLDVSFKSGKNTLRGHIYGAENTRGLIVFAHGIGTGHESYIEILLALADRGWRVFAYDATGCCESDGNGTQGLTQSAFDLDAALTFAESDERLSGLPTFVLGHSWGGYASAAVLNYGHELKACATLSGFSEPMKELTDTAQVILGNAGKLMKPYIALYCRMKFGRDYDLSAVDGINKADIPVLVIHGKNDRTVRYDSAAIINQRKRIKNKQVKYTVMKKKRMRGHNNYLFSKKAIKYIYSVVNPAYQELFDEYYGTIPDDAREQFFKELDADLLNEINMDIVDAVDEFFGAAL